MTPTAKRLLADFKDAAENLGHWKAKDGVLRSRSLERAEWTFMAAHNALTEYLERRETELRRLRKWKRDRIEDDRAFEDFLLKRGEYMAEITRGT